MPVTNTSLITAYNSVSPPAFDGNPGLFFMTVLSMLLVVLLACEWLWRVVWSFWERPAALRSPVTVVRIVYISLLLGALVRTGPDLWLLMRWPAIDPEHRVWLATFDARLDSTAFIFFSLAWLTAKLGEPMMIYQLEKKPIPVHLWPTWEQVKRPLKIGMGVAAIAFAITFLR